MTHGYLPFPEAAAYIGRSSRWLRRRLDRIRHYRPPGGQILFRREDIDEFMKSYVIEPTLPPKVDLDSILNSIARAPKRRQAKKGANA